MICRYAPALLPARRVAEWGGSKFMAEKMDGGIPIDFFSTSRIAPRDRHAAWAARDEATVGSLYETTPREAFNVESTRVFLGGMMVGYGEISSQGYERSAATMRSYHPDLLNLHYMIAGHAQGVAGDRTFDQPAGTLFWTDVAQGSKHVSTASRSVMLSIPRPVAVDMGLNVRALHGATLSSPLATMLGSHLHHIVQAAPELESAQVQRLARSVTDLVILAASMVGEGPGLDPASHRAVTLRQIRDDIDGRLDSATLTSGDLCRRFGISRTSLYRMFADYGGVQAFVRERRLLAAREALRNPGNYETIGAIAARLGFSDQAHLGRLFRARFGMTPGDCRAEAHSRGA